MLVNFHRYTQISILNKLVYRKKHHTIKIITSVFYRKHYFRSLLIYTSILYTAIINCNEDNFYNPWAFFISTAEINNNSFYFKKLLLK